MIAARDGNYAGDDLTKISQGSLYQEAVDRLRDAIISGYFAAGEHLGVNEIAERLGISRTPVREAFIQLEQEGLIERIVNRGSFVKDFSAKEIKEIFGLRTALEEYAWQIAVEQIKKNDLQYLEALIGQQSRAIAEGDNIKLVKLDSLFHQYLCNLTDSPRLLKMWSEIEWLRQTVIIRLFRASPRLAPPVVEEDHRHILQAFNERDVEKLLQLNRETNKAVVKRCIKALSTKE